MNINKVKQVLKETFSTTFEIQINELANNIKKTEDPNKIGKLENTLKYYNVGVKPLTATSYYDVKQELEGIIKS